MKKAVLALTVAIVLTMSACETLDHWLYGASDYFIRTEADSLIYDYYWDDVDLDLWYDDYEYD